ncbi:MULTISPECIES: enoyl-CoA hydratase [unclassified Mesorhizobium]|uniref:enoyl-CoA hydratase n=1 Tax=unclassified Mesorhizobium TaxID=325217 RepID=UPI00112E5884|nr:MULTISPECIES: enoyl-CoA hydratase [unclassified Mesorhizobium]MBZ9998757.1 enoyl-CoA hydratase [Mesorhizobium sp. B264B2A]MCA0005302.1 enoyl-CoA hydratase [Mesorhizobium sp. B264B1B]MCA0017195.1 enoyl-CoA hydratase [Mesorhizobium sp. B264B1A]TPJ46881.1 enoyl-CoA hydratase [Mesorhizobium sp. B2-6-6]
MAEILAIKPVAVEGPVAASRDEGVLRLTLANPPANALSLAVMAALTEELDRARADKAVRVIVLSAAGKVFCAGHDLKEMTARRADADRGKAFFEETFAACATLMQAIVRHPKPVIAEVDGLATAAGLQLVASCDLAIASHEATFCTPGVNIGLFCSTPMVALSRNVSRKHAMEMLLTGETIDAATAKEFGLVNRVAPREYLNQIVNKYAQTIASKSSSVLKTGKEAFYAQAEMGLADAYGYTGRVMVENMLARDAQEGIGAFIGKREPEWTDE